MTNVWTLEGAEELQKAEKGPGQVPQLVGAFSHALEGCGFDPPSGHTPRLWFWSLVEATNWFFTSHWCFSTPPQKKRAEKGSEIQAGNQDSLVSW